MIDYQHEETETDRMIDAMYKPMPEAERDRIIKRISKEIEAMDNAERVQPAQPSTATQAA